MTNVAGAQFGGQRDGVGSNVGGVGGWGRWLGVMGDNRFASHTQVVDRQFEECCMPAQSRC